MIDGIGAFNEHRLMARGERERRAEFLGRLSAVDIGDPQAGSDIAFGVHRKNHGVTLVAGIENQVPVFLTQTGYSEKWRNEAME